MNELSEITTYRFKVDDNGDVGFLLATGNDFAKNKMTLENAKNIACTGEVKPSDEVLCSIQESNVSFKCR